MRGDYNHLSSSNFAGHRAALRDSVRHQGELKDGFPSRRQSVQLFDDSKSSRGADGVISNRVRRHRFVVRRLQLARIRAPRGFASFAERRAARRTGRAKSGTSATAQTAPEKKTNTA